MTPFVPVDWLFQHQVMFCTEICYCISTLNFAHKLEIGMKLLNLHSVPNLKNNLSLNRITSRDDCNASVDSNPIVKSNSTPHTARFLWAIRLDWEIGFWLLRRFLAGSSKGFFNDRQLRLETDQTTHLYSNQMPRSKEMFCRPKAWVTLPFCNRQVPDDADWKKQEELRILREACAWFQKAEKAEYPYSLQPYKIHAWALWILERIQTSPYQGK